MTNTAEKQSISEKLISTLELEKNGLDANESRRALQKEALESFLKQGLPHRKNEEYKYSPVSNLFKSDLVAATAQSGPGLKKSDIAELRIPGLDSHLITVVNGFVSEELSDYNPAGKSVQIFHTLGTVKNTPVLFDKHFGQFASPASDPFIALNTLAFKDAVFIQIPENAVVEKPIVILNITNATQACLASPRCLIHVGKNASVQIIELYVALSQNDQVVSNSVSEIILEQGAKALFYKIQDNCPKLNLFTTTQASQESDSHFDTHTVTLSGSWIRNNLNIVLNGEHCETHLNGLFLLNENQHVDNHTLVDHSKPNCESNQLYKGILDDKSSGVFNGKIFVRRDAQKTNAYQSSKNMLLSDDASINAKPQLEIYADDVKCSHGSSTGQIDEEALFYLRARGISPEGAKSLLMLAFTQDVVNTIRIDALRKHAEGLIEKRLSK